MSRTTKNLVKVQLKICISGKPKRESTSSKKEQKEGAKLKKHELANQEGQNESHNQKKGIQVKQGDLLEPQDHPVNKGEHNNNRMQI